MGQISKNLEETNAEEDLHNKLYQNNDKDEISRDFQISETYYDPQIGKSKQGASCVHHVVYEQDKQVGIKLKFLGSPLSEKITDDHGLTISYFEHGIAVEGIGIPEPIICTYRFPKIGNPGVVSPDRIYEIKNFICGVFNHIKKSVYDDIIQKRPNFFEGIFSDKFFLRAVSSNSSKGDVPLLPEITVQPIGSPVMNEKEVIVSVQLGPNSTVALHDKTLFDLVFKFDDQHLVVAPHGIYANKSWDNFVILHVTDMHVSRRIEYAKDDLKKMSAERPDLINEFNIRYFNNFNDNFRDFISYANSLYKSGSLDCILATGDLIDYIFDSTEQTAKTPRNVADIDTVNGNNFDFFKRLILGLEPGRDGTENEELLVPIFTSLGNHDYRAMPYYWAGELDPALMTGDTEGAVEGAVIGTVIASFFGVGLVGTVIGGLFGGLVDTEVPIPFIDNRDLSFYTPTNLLLSEAIALEGGEKAVFGPKRGIAIVAVIETLPRYDTINTQRSYIVSLGPHRIVMLDSANDVGIIDTNLDAFLNAIGRDSEDSKKFGRETPNSRGVEQMHIDLLTQAIAEAGSTGVVIVTIHAPLADLSSYPHYLRETDRSASDENLNKRGFPYFNPFRSYEDDNSGSGKKAGWPIVDTPYFKYGGVDFTLATGVSKGLNQQFLETCAGVGLSRKVDLVLSGHGHYNFEFRLGFDPDSGLLFFHDYYTENPLRYYAMKLLSESDFNSFIKESKLEGGEDSKPLGTAYRKYLDKMEFFFVVPKGGLSKPRFAQTSIPRADGGDPIIAESIEVPAYSSPLNKTNDKVSWWINHRPLFIETEALGPISTKNSFVVNPDARLSDYGFFQGCRKITIKNNVISSIEVIRMNEIRGPRPRLCSLKELCKVRGISFPASLRSLAQDIQNNVITFIEVVRMIPGPTPRPRLCSLKELCKVRGISFPASIRSLAKDIKYIPPISERLKI